MPETPEQTTLDVLVVDDDEAVLLLFGACLKAAGYEVATASSGEEAFDLIRKRRPEMIISDIRMPGMDGFELCRRLRRAGFDDIPFLFCSVLGTPLQQVEGLARGADDYLVKPVDPALLVERVDQFRRRNQDLPRIARLTKALRTERRVSGDLSTVSVPDLLRALAHGRIQNARITLGGEDEIQIERSRLRHARKGDIEGSVAFDLLAGLREGPFEVRVGRGKAPANMNETMESALVGGLSCLKALDRIRRKIPDVEEAILRRVRADAPPGLSPHETAILDRIGPGGSLLEVISGGPSRPRHALRVVTDLHERGLVSIRAIGDHAGDLPTTEIGIVPISDEEIGSGPGTRRGLGAATLLSAVLIVLLAAAAVVWRARTGHDTASIDLVSSVTPSTSVDVERDPRSEIEPALTSQSSGSARDTSVGTNPANETRADGDTTGTERAELPPSRHAPMLDVPGRARLRAGVRANVRRRPEGDLITTLSGPSILEIISGPELRPGRTDSIAWWGIRLENGDLGWIAGNTSRGPLIERIPESERD